MRSIGQAMLAVLVIGGWLLCLVWLAVSVSQIAVDRATTTTVPVCSREIASCLR